MFDREREAGYSNNAMRKNRMKRMEELSHSLDDGLNNLPDDYGRSQRGSASGGGRRVDPRYDDMDDEDDYGDDDYIDDYYYSNSKPSYDNRPRSYNEKYSYGYDEYDSNFNRNRYSLNEAAMSKNSRYQQSPSSQQKYSSLRKPQDTKGLSSSSGNGHHGSNKHILFNDEDDVMYMSEKKKSTTSSTSSTKKSTAKKDVKKETTMNETITASTPTANKKKLTKEDLSPTTKSEKFSSLQVMKAKLKIHNLSNDDSALQTRSNKLQNAFHRHHSVESKMPPSPHHHSDRSNMSPTIMEEIEFELQDVESETVESDKDKKGKEKSKDKDKKGNSSAPSTPTTKKSLKAHLINQKKLFKVPDIDLNKFSCLFSSNKIAALRGKKEESTTKSAEALNEPSSSSKSSPKSSPTTKSPPTSSIAAATKTPPLSPKKIIKSESKSDKSAQERANAESVVVEEKYEKIIKVDNEEFDEGCEEEELEESISDDEFQVIYNQTANNDDVESIKTFSLLINF
jgi:hypothetical protein